MYWRSFATGKKKKKKNTSTQLQEHQEREIDVKGDTKGESITIPGPIDK